MEEKECEGEGGGDPEDGGGESVGEGLAGGVGGGAGVEQTGDREAAANVDKLRRQESEEKKMEADPSAGRGGSWRDLWGHLFCMLQGAGAECPEG